MARVPWSVPIMWPDGPAVVIIGGGPSLNLQQVRHVAIARLKNKCRVIAVNDAVYPCWFSDWLHSCDSKWWMWHRETAIKFSGIKTTCTEAALTQWAEYIRVQINPETGNTGGFAEDSDAVCGGGNGGYQAMQLAVKAGGKKLVLVGFDMHDIGQTDKPEKAHWFGDHPDKIRSDYSGTMLPYFPTLIEPLAERGVEVINATPGSAIDCFPMANLEDLF